MYIMDYNSNFPILSQAISGLTTIAYPLTVVLQAPGGIDFTTAYNFPAGSSTIGGVVNGV